MIRYFIQVICFIGALVTSGLSLAESYWYSVEYILFEHQASTVQDQEPWSGTPSQIPENAVGLIPVIESPEDWTSYRRMRSDELSLSGAQRVLGRSVSYNIIDHSGWVQRIDEDLLSTPIRIQIDAPSRQVLGTLAFRRARFLHLDIDLTLNESPVTYAYSDSDMVQPTSYRLHQTRRIKTEELHYFDHPRFGVLIKVIPLTPPEPEIVLPEAGPALDPNAVSASETPTVSSESAKPDEKTQPGNQGDSAR